MPIPPTEHNLLKQYYQKRRNIGIGAGFALLAFELLLILVVNSYLYQIFTFFVISLLVWGGYNWAKYKGRNDYWAIVIALGPLGFLILMQLADYMPWETKMKFERRKKFSR
ncbi:hypothetical protein ACFLXN_00170 [Chloroflexota bacterium]